MPAAATRPTSTTTGRCSTPRNATYTKGAHTFRFGGDIVRQAMNRHELGNGSGQFTFARRSDGALRRSVSQSVQHVRLVPARSADGRVEEHHPVRRGIHAEPQLAVQLLRERSVAAHAEPHCVARPPLRLLPGRRANDPWHGAIRPETNTMLICGLGVGAGRLRLRHGCRQRVAAFRCRLSSG